MKSHLIITHIEKHRSYVVIHFASRTIWKMHKVKYVDISHPNHQKNGYCKNPLPESFKSQYRNLLQIPRKLTPEKITKSPKLNPDLLGKSPQRSPQKS